MISDGLHDNIITMRWRFSWSIFELRNKASLYIKVGAMVVKRFKEENDKKARAVIRDCIKHTNREKDKEAFEDLLNGSLII